MTTNNQQKQSQQQKREKELEKKLKEIQVRELEERAKELAKINNLPYLDLSKTPIDKEALFTIDENEARLANLAIISKSGKNLKIVVTDPQNKQTENLIKKLKQKGFNTRLYVVSQKSINKALELYQEKIEIKPTKLGVIKIEESKLTELQKEIKNISGLKEKITQVSTTEIIEFIFAGALKVKASDIHFEPGEKNIRLRYRIDGVLQNIFEFDKNKYKPILNRLKVMAGLKLNIHDAPQDGRFTIRQKDIDIEIRVSVLPGAYGENIVMRILDPRTIKKDLKDLGLREDLLKQIKLQLDKKTGAILTTGPTGSGKTTTLYAFINYLNKPPIKIITIEDPIEYHIEGISQTQVDPEGGYGFANGLRSIVRQDPDVILVGEIRDVETAEIAMHAALTGHLVLSTLHTNNASGTIPRLIDMGIKPQIIAPALNMALAQRLVRKLCPKCKKKRKVKPDELEKIKSVLNKLPPNKTPKLNLDLEISYSEGCNECNLTGYKGRTGVFEAFLIDREIEKTILQSPSINELDDLLSKKGMINMIQDGYLKVLEGITDIKEVERVLGAENTST